MIRPGCTLGTMSDLLSPNGANQVRLGCDEASLRQRRRGFASHDSHPGTIQTFVEVKQQSSTSKHLELNEVRM